MTRVNNMEHETKEIATDELVAKANKLAKLVEYQGKTIVSRTMIDKAAGTVTLFAFDETQKLSEHTAPFDALVYLLDGEAAFVIAGKILRLKAGEMTIMPANKPHAVRATRKFKMILTMVRS